MEYYDSIEKVIDHIEENLKENFSLEDLAKIACMSEFHFHRVFSFITNETIMKYVRKRRLTGASYELINTDKAIIEIAFDYGYESQESFTRSFKSLFNETPNKFRKNENHGFLNAYRSKMNLENIKIKKGEIKMEYKIVEREKMLLVGLECTTTTKENTEKNVIPMLWGEFNFRIREVANQTGKREAIGFCGEVKKYTPDIKMSEDVEFRYLAGVEVTSIDSIPEGMKAIEVPKQKYIVFTHKGALDTLGDTYKAIYTKAFPESGFIPDKAFEFELYDERFISPIDPRTEMDIYIPIREKSSENSDELITRGIKKS